MGLLSLLPLAIATKIPAPWKPVQDAMLQPRSWLKFVSSAVTETFILWNLFYQSSCRCWGSLLHLISLSLSLSHTLGKTPQDEWSARHKGLYLHNKHNRQTLMPPTGSKPAIPATERPQACDWKLPELKADTVKTVLNVLHRWQWARKGTDKNCPTSRYGIIYS
jgi:hypothetical protein